MSSRLRLLKHNTKTMTTKNVTPTNYDNTRKDKEEFESTKLGVKGLLDSGITHVPPLFHHPPQPLELGLDNECLIPVIDLSRPHPEVVERVREAASNVGFFQVVNHGVPMSLLDRLVSGVRTFHELPAAEKASLYRRGTTTDGVATSFFSNYDLFAAKAACWRDTLQVRLGPTPLKPNDIPIVCRDEVMEWKKECEKLADIIMGLLCEGLGLSEHRLKGMDYVGRINMVGHYYPYCPEPEKTVGFPSHTDPGMLTVLIQDQTGGLQVNCHGKWVNVKPVHGALIVNLGDMFQIISNDEYKSGEHRVIANPLGDARVAIATFINPGTHDNFYEPLPELISAEKPALYRQFQFSELFSWFLNKELESRGVTSYYRL